MADFKETEQYLGLDKEVWGSVEDKENALSLLSATVPTDVEVGTKFQLSYSGYNPMELVEGVCHSHQTRSPRGYMASLRLPTTAHG